MNMKNISHEMNLKKWTGIVEECRNSGQTAVVSTAKIYPKATGLACP